MVKRQVIVRCLLLDWNHWMSVHAMNFYFYLWLLKILWPEKTSSWCQWRHCWIFTHKSTYGVRYRTGSPGQLGLQVTGFPGHWVTKCDPVPSLARSVLTLLVVHQGSDLINCLWLFYDHLVPAYPGSPGQRDVKQLYVCMCNIKKSLKNYIQWHSCSRHSWWEWIYVSCHWECTDVGWLFVTLSAHHIQQCHQDSSCACRQ